MLFDRSEHKNYDLDKVRVCGKHRYLLIFHILNNENWQTSELAIGSSAPKFLQQFSGDAEKNSRHGGL